MKSFVVSLHDVAPSTAESSRRWVELLDDRGIRASLLVVPGMWNGMSLDSSTGFTTWLREAEARGHEVVQHGFRHVRTDSFSLGRVREIVGRVLARGCEEFWHLPTKRAAELMTLGREILVGQGFDVRGFVAPGWLMSKGALLAASHLEYGYTCTHTHVIDLSSGRRLLAPTTSQRPRSHLSGVGVKWNKTLVTVAARQGDVVRVALHPDDLHESKLRRANLDMCDRLRERGHRSSTYRDVVPT